MLVLFLQILFITKGLLSTLYVYNMLKLVWILLGTTDSVINNFCYIYVRSRAPEVYSKGFDNGLT